jgi:hypothetical protein
MEDGGNGPGLSLMAVTEDGCAYFGIPLHLSHRPSVADVGSSAIAQQSLRSPSGVAVQLKATQACIAKKLIPVQIAIVIGNQIHARTVSKMIATSRVSKAWL